MTARRRTVEAAAAQREIIAALRAAGDIRAAEQLQRCMQARLARRHGSGWPWTCRSVPACVWCGKAMARKWWLGLVRWTAENGDPASLIILSLRHRPGGLRAASARLRRALRDVRDRTARHSWRWRGVAVAGMVSGDGTAVVLVRHLGILRQEIVEVFGRRWPELAVDDVGAVSPSWEFAVRDAVELAQARRGVEPLRLVVSPQRSPAFPLSRDAGCLLDANLEPMPVLL